MIIGKIYYKYVIYMSTMIGMTLSLIKLNFIY